MKVLITGGSGFLGAWICRHLSMRGDSIRIFDLVERRVTVEAIAGIGAAAACEWLLGDIANFEMVLKAARGCDAIIHLAGVLTSSCQEDPIAAARINFLGTLNVFESARQLRIKKVIYTSTAGVFGPSSGVVPMPTSHYGVFKLACEGSARAYWYDHGLSSIGFRPYVVYGPGREGGLSAAPTLACRAAAIGERYTFSYRGPAGLVYVDDVAAAYERSLRHPGDGALVFNMIGEQATPEDVILELKRLAPDCEIHCGGEPIPAAPVIEEGNLREVLPNIPSTPLRVGIARTFAYYQNGGL